MSHKTTAILIISGSVAAIAGYVIYETERKKREAEKSNNIGGSLPMNVNFASIFNTVNSNPRNPIVSTPPINPFHPPTTPPCNPNSFGCGKFINATLPTGGVVSLSESQLNNFGLTREPTRHPMKY